MAHIGRIATLYGQRSSALLNALGGVIRRVLEAVRIWRRRSSYRRQLGAMSERQLNDMGMSWAEIAFEIEKPFWRESRMDGGISPPPSRCGFQRAVRRSA